MSEQTIYPAHQGPQIQDQDPALEHGATDRSYVMVAIFLAVMTALEVVCSYTEDHLGPFYDWVLIVLMSIKFFTVALYFMHLKYDQKMARYVFFFGLSVAGVVYVAALGTFQYWGSGFR